MEPLDALRDRARQVAAAPSFYDALARPGVAVIAEVKRASPSRGDLAPGIDAATQAKRYVEGGAAAVSVLTEPERFKGSLDDLAAVATLGTPALRKDFLVDPYQVWEARAAGASAALLIVAALRRDDLVALVGEMQDAGVEPLVEVHDEAEAEAAISSGARIIGVNARDLRTFEIHRDAFERIRPKLPDGVLAIAESGIRGPDDVRTAKAQGADAVLVGETVVLSDDPTAMVRSLVEAGAASH